MMLDNFSKNFKIHLVNQPLFLSNNFLLSDIEEEKESSEYEAFNAKLNNLNVKFRTSKITPTKIGQFVTLWRRNSKGVTEPFNTLDNFDFYFIIASTDNNLGVFIFSRECLTKNGILINGEKDGKRGFRVYPTWDTPVATQAIKTQKWQSECFVDLSDRNKIDMEKFKLLIRK